MAQPTSTPTDFSTLPGPLTVPPNGKALPLLHSGDRLTVEEFERRYAAMPDLKKAELIEGVVYVSSPVSQSHHSSQHIRLATILGWYCLHTPGVDAGDNATLKVTKGVSQPQPDCLLFISSECGGDARLDDKGYLHGAPELVGEVSYSSANYDLHAKKEVYRINGVREYLVWRTEDHALDWFRLRDDQYEPLPPDADGILKSQIFPGLWLDARALLARNSPRVIEILQRGIASPKHQAFVQELQTRREAPKNS